MKYRTKTIEVEATQWNAPGDHPAVGALTEEVVRGLPGWMQDDLSNMRGPRYIGVVGQGSYARFVHAGDWIIDANEFAPLQVMRPHEFAYEFEPVDAGDYRSRAKAEAVEVADKVAKLSDFIHLTSAFKGLPPDEQRLLHAQLDGMTAYLGALNARIAMWGAE